LYDTPARCNGRMMQPSTFSVPQKTGTRFHVPVDGVRATPVRLFETPAVMVHRFNQAEHERRLGHHLGSVNSLELLDVLMELPLRTAIRRSSFTDAARRVLLRAPAGVVEVNGASITRLAEPVVTPVMAVVYESDWDSALSRASRFASYCPRMVVTPELPSAAGESLAEASFYGIGVAIGPKSSPAMVLEPETLEDWRPTPAWWQFCERVYSQILQRDLASN
jgi:hypothetical protein